MKLFTFWEGPRPAYIDLCLETRDRHSPGHTILTYADGLGRPRDSYFMAMQKAHQADLIRVDVIEQEGGIWADADCIFLGNPSDMVDPTSKDLLYYSDGGDLANGFFAAPKWHLVMREWRRLNWVVFENHKRMGTSPHNIPWRSFGTDQMNQVIRKDPLGPIRSVGVHRVQPIYWPERDKFFEVVEDPLQQWLSVWRGAYAYMLFNNTFPAWFKALSRDEILRGPWRISAIFRAALGVDA